MENIFRTITAGTTFLSPTDFYLQIDTSAGAVTIVPPNADAIFTSGNTNVYSYIGIRFVDISNNASVNNITITGNGDTINGQSSIVLNTNGIGGLLTPIQLLRYKKF